MKSHDWSEDSEEPCGHSEEWFGGEEEAFIVNAQLFHIIIVVIITIGNIIIFMRIIITNISSQKPDQFDCENLYLSLYFFRFVFYIFSDFLCEKVFLIYPGWERSCKLFSQSPLCIVLILSTIVMMMVMMMNMMTMTMMMT